MQLDSLAGAGGLKWAWGVEVGDGLLISHPRKAHRMLAPRMLTQGAQAGAVFLSGLRERPRLWREARETHDKTMLLAMNLISSKATICYFLIV